MKHLTSYMSVILIFVIASCGKDTELHQVFDDNGNLIEEYTRNTKDLTKEGIYTRFYQDGKTPAERTTFVRDTMDGWQVLFNEKGDTSRISKVEMGVLNGIHKEYHPNGQVSQLYYHVNGEIKGLFKEFHESGALKGEILFSENTENGPFVEFHENGKKAWEGIYKNGKENGEIRKFDENGELIRKLNCVMGRCETTWKKEGIED